MVHNIGIAWENKGMINGAISDCFKDEVKSSGNTLQSR